ncbi:MAG: hypothetical protein OXG24_06925 [Gammaproteobacteria bacterium]|nr:hypothetical protein [Gammaproteobacteria bacterium]
MAILSTGQRLKSGVCTTEIMVITAPQEDLDLTCGGAPMTSNGDESNVSLDPAFAEGTTIGKRYVNADGKLEILCVKPGQGTLAISGDRLKLKDSKKLPKTD